MVKLSNCSTWGRAACDSIGPESNLGQGNNIIITTLQPLRIDLYWILSDEICLK